MVPLSTCSRACLSPFFSLARPPRYFCPCCSFAPLPLARRRYVDVCRCYGSARGASPLPSSSSAGSHGVAATRLEPRTKREATANRLGTVMSLRAPFDPISAFISSTSLSTLRTLRASLRPLVIAIIIICTFARVHSTL